MKETSHGKHRKEKITPPPKEILREYSPLIRRTAAAYLQSPEDIEECISETFFEFYLHLDRYDPEKGSCATLLASIARNKAIDLYRRNRRASSGFSSLQKLLSGSRQEGKTSSGLAASIEDLPDPEDMAEQIAQRLDLERAISSLKPCESELIRMKYFDGLTLKEIALLLDLSYETVKKRHQRALRKLRRQQNC